MSSPSHDYEVPIHDTTGASTEGRKLKRPHSETALANLGTAAAAANNNNNNNNNDCDGAASMSPSWAPPGSDPAPPQQQQQHGQTSPSPYRRSETVPVMTTPSSRRRRRKPTATTTTTTTTEEVVAKSLPDKLRDTALAGTMELLKLAGGVTLSTTTSLAAPPIHAVRTVVLPVLWEAIQDWLRTVVHQRVKDWFRILSSSVRHIVTVLKNTQRGAVFRRKIANVGVDLVDVLSSDASRQAMIDGMACLVKLSEALHTPETRALLDQLSVLSCRVVDAASSGRNKQLLHDLSDATWAGLELVSDPSATLALAEVTAYLCHALEMEDSVYRGTSGGGGGGGGSSSSSAAERRHQRNLYQRQTYVDPHVLQDPHSTVEQVMLSSLDHSRNNAYNAASAADGTHALPPRNILPGQQQQQQQESMSVSTKTSDGDVPPGLAAHHMETDDVEEWKEDLDVAYLNEQISLRAANLERQQAHRTKRVWNDAATSYRPRRPPPVDHHAQPKTRAKGDDDYDLEELVVTTVEDDDSDEGDGKRNTSMMETKEKHVEGRRGDGRVGLSYEASQETSLLDFNHDDTERDTDIPRLISPPAFEDGEESALARFYRSLDELMAKQRTEAVDRILASQSGPSDSSNLTFYPRAASAAGAGNERGQDTIKSRMLAMPEALREKSKIGVGIKPPSAKEKRKLEAALMRSCFGLLNLAWFAFGCFGIYAILFSGPGANRQAPESPITTTQSTQEVVVRIVREVVHVSPDGTVIQTVPDADYGKGAEDTLDLERIANCVADASSAP